MTILQFSTEQEASAVADPKEICFTAGYFIVRTGDDIPIAQPIICSKVNFIKTISSPIDYYAQLQAQINSLRTLPTQTESQKLIIRLFDNMPDNIHSNDPIVLAAATMINLTPEQVLSIFEQANALG